MDRPTRRMAFLDDAAVAIRAGETTVTYRIGEAPPCAVGDRLAVCEALIPHAGWVAYRGDQTWLPLRPEEVGSPLRNWPWKVRVIPARCCPAWAVRTYLRVVDVRRETIEAGLVETFRASWRAAHGVTLSERWVADPFVWRVQFKREVPHA